MAMNWKEAAESASMEQQQRFASGIAVATRYLDKLVREGKIPERFTPEIHPVLKGVACEALVIGGKSTNELLQEMIAQGIQVPADSRRITEDPRFETSLEQREIELVIVNLSELMPNANYPKIYPTLPEIYAAARERGLDTVPAEVGLYYRLFHRHQPQGQHHIMAMEPIRDSHGNPLVFVVSSYEENEEWFSTYGADPSYKWDPKRSVFVFRLRK